MLASIALMGLLGMPAVPGAAEKPEVTKQILMLRESLMAKVGSTVIISLEPSVLKGIEQRKTNEPPLHIQWRINDSDISAATNGTYTINAVGVSHVGAYTAVLTGSIEAESLPAHLSVYQLYENQSNGGTLTVGIGEFTTGSGPSCLASLGFDKYKVYTTFCGPSTPTCTGIFANTSNSTKLDVNTCTNINNSIDTGIQIRDNFGFMTERACTNDSNCSLPNTTLSKTLPVTLQNGKFYRVGIFYKSASLGSSTHVTFNWNYHN